MRTEHSTERRPFGLASRSVILAGAFRGHRRRGVPAKLLSLAIRSEATCYVILDIEPTVAALVPFFGILMDRHPTRKAFLSRLMGVELTDQEFRWLVEPDHVEQQQEKSLEKYLKTRVAEIVRRVPSDTRRRNMETLRRLMLDEVLARSQIPSSRHSQVLSNLSSLLDAEKSPTDYPARVLPADKERGLLEFLHNHASVCSFIADSRRVDRGAGSLEGTAGELEGLGREPRHRPGLAPSGRTARTRGRFVLF